MLAVDWVDPLKLLSAIPRMKILLRPSPSSVFWSTGVSRATSSSALGLLPTPPGAKPVATMMLPGKRSSGAFCLLAVTTMSL